VNGAQTNGEIPVRTWRDLWAFVVVIAMIVGSFTVLQVQSSQHSAEIQELKEDSLRKDSFDQFTSDVDRRLDRIERKIDEETELKKIN
jgi:hypothetical protein